MNQELNATYCCICGKSILTLQELNRVPLIDPYASPHCVELQELVASPVHFDCWAHHPLWQEVARLAVIDSRQMFKGGEALLDVEYAGAWSKVVPGSPSGTGTLFLPRSAYIYPNLSGADVKGGFASGTAEDVSKMVSFLRLIGSSYNVETARKTMPEINVELTESENNVILGFGDLERLCINLYLDDIRLLAPIN